MKIRNSAEIPLQSGQVRAAMKHLNVAFLVTRSTRCWKVSSCGTEKPAGGGICCAALSIISFSTSVDEEIELLPLFAVNRWRFLY